MFENEGRFECEGGRREVEADDRAIVDLRLRRGVVLATAAFGCGGIVSSQDRYGRTFASVTGV